MEKRLDSDMIDYAIFIHDLTEDEWITYVKANLITLNDVEDPVNSKIYAVLGLASLIAGGALAAILLRRGFKALKL